MTRRGLLAGLLCLASLASASVACSRTERAAPSSLASPTRIVSLAPSMTEALFAIGAGDRVVGRSRFCDFPPQVLALPVVGDVNPDLEVILALRPDLVVGVRSLSSARLVDQLAAHHIQGWFPEAGSLAGIDAVLLGLGERVGRAAEARRLVDDLRARERAIEQSMADQPRVRVLMVVSLEPVVVAGPKSFAAELIRAAGGQNVVEGGEAWPTVGFETIITMDPDMVLDATLVGSQEASRIAPSAPGWDALRAVRGGHVVAIRDPRVLRAGPRIAEGLAVLARALHPAAAVP